MLSGPAIIKCVSGNFWYAWAKAGANKSNPFLGSMRPKNIINL